MIVVMMIIAKEKIIEMMNEILVRDLSRADQIEVSFNQKINAKKERQLQKRSWLHMCVSQPTLGSIGTSQGDEARIGLTRLEG